MPAKRKRLGVSVVTGTGPRKMGEPMQTTKPPGAAVKGRSQKAGSRGAGARSAPSKDE